MRSKRVWGLLAAGFCMVVLYIVIACVQNDFSFPDLTYGKNVNLFMKGMPSATVHSQFWKLFFILPAVILFAVAWARTDFRVPRIKDVGRRYFIPALLIISAAVLFLSVELLFHETEVTDDENTYDFMAATLLGGRVANPPPPVITNFINVFIINNGTIWTGRYTMGHPAIIALGMAMGNRYIFTVGLSVLTLLLLYLIGMRLYGEKKTALLALCLGAISPFFYLISSSRLSHTTSAFFLASFMYLFLRGKEEERPAWKFIFLFLSGLCIGYAFNARQWTAFAFSIPFLILIAKDLLKGPRGPVLRNYAALAAGFGLLFLLTLYGNFLVTGKALLFPYSYYDPNEYLGFGSYGHTFADSLRNLAVCLTRLNAFLFGFPVSLIFVFILFFRRKVFGDYLLFGIAGSIAAAYMLFHSTGVSDLGPVYYYEMFIPLMLLSARGVLFLHEKITGICSYGSRIVPAFILLSFVGALGTFIPERIYHIYRLTKEIREPYETVEASGIHNALVMIKKYTHKGWVFGYRNPSPAFTDDVIYCHYADSSSNSALVRYFKDRSPYVLQYDSTETRFRLFSADQTGRPLPEKK